MRIACSMNNAFHLRSPRALTAIAAVLALSATPAIAQEVAPVEAPAAPVVIQPEAATSAPAPAPAPVAVQPAPAQPTVVTTSTPVVQSVPAEPEVAAPAAKPAPAPRVAAKPAQPPARAATPAAVREAPAPAVPVAQSPAQRAAPAPGALASGPAPVRAPVAATPSPAAPAPTSNDATLPVAGIVGLLAALGIAGLGIAAMRSRRRARQDEWDAAEEPAVVAETPPPAPMPVAMEPVLLEPALEERGVPAAVIPIAVASSRPMPRQVAPRHAGATAVMLGTLMPETAEERQNLLERMVAAEPDEGNPFHSHKSRLRRARIQLQHRERLAQEAAARGEPFDFRTYRPSTTFSTSAKTELVDS